MWETAVSEPACFDCGAPAARSFGFDPDLCAGCLAERATIIHADPSPDEKPPPEPPVFRRDVFGASGE
jgi:hypothetical protein